MTGLPRGSYLASAYRDMTYTFDVVYFIDDANINK